MRTYLRVVAKQATSGQLSKSRKSSNERKKKTDDQEDGRQMSVMKERKEERQTNSRIYDKHPGALPLLRQYWSVKEERDR
jgi:hypothetical protein